MLTFFTPFDVKMIQISTFPAAPSTERVPSLAERVASLRYSINRQLLNNRVPGLNVMLTVTVPSYENRSFLNNYARSCEMGQILGFFFSHEIKLIVEVDEVHDIALFLLLLPFHLLLPSHHPVGNILLLNFIK